MKVEILWRENPLSAVWQKKKFANEKAAVEFIFKHSFSIWGINRNVCMNTPALTHFDIIRYLRCDWNQKGEGNQNEYKRIY